MKIFNEETLCEGKSDMWILVLNKKEAMMLVKMADAAAKSNKRKKSWYKMWEELYSKLCCF